MRDGPVRLYGLIPEGSCSRRGWLGEFARVYALNNNGEPEQAATIVLASFHTMRDLLRQ